MSTKADYTNEEWELLCAGPLLAGLGVSLLDPGLISGLQESAAINSAVHEAKTAYADNELVKAVVAAIEAKGEQALQAPQGATSESVLEKLQKIDALLDAKGKASEAAADEGIIFRNFLYQIADRAANAAGGFMGLGDKVSEDEAYYLKKLKEILFREPAAS